MLPAYLAEDSRTHREQQFCPPGAGGFQRRCTATPRRRHLGSRAFQRDTWPGTPSGLSELPIRCAEVDCSGYFKDVESIIRSTPIAGQDFAALPGRCRRQHPREELWTCWSDSALQPLRGEILHAARYGVWAYHHGDPEQYCGGPPYFWEVYEDNLISGAASQRLTDDPDAGRYLYKGSLPHPGKFLGPQSRAARIGARQRSSSKSSISCTNQVGNHRG